MDMGLLFWSVFISSSEHLFSSSLWPWRVDISPSPALSSIYLLDHHWTYFKRLRNAEPTFCSASIMNFILNRRSPKYRNLCNMQYVICHKYSKKLPNKMPINVVNNIIKFLYSCFYLKSTSLVPGSELELCHIILSSRLPTSSGHSDPNLALSASASPGQLHSGDNRLANINN